MPEPESIRIVHDTKRSCMATVPIWTKPIAGLRRPCPTCNIIHPVKTVHLWLDDVGSCLVSRGVLEDLQRAGMPELAVVASLKSPPPLTLGKPREVVDNRNRKIQMWEATSV